MQTQPSTKREYPTYPELIDKYQSNYIPYIDLLQALEWQEKRQEILLRDRHKCHKCGMAAGESKFLGSCLQVHHTYYSVQKVCLKQNKFIHNLPWDYPDKAFITLCLQCHKKIHETTKIPVYEEITPGKYSHKDFSPCRRCKGVGYFPQHKHIIGGICFRCGGQRFEELIS
jgi:5-methylcytosine-specific restriction endonuclease McrA